ncbi:MAG: 6-pyruvoyl trahydropterin synthase family protein [Planctomycetota bacterium]|jgi:6-pyruvoyltetrahydropterin/6-carboxytetrahydropterin synthase
MHKLGRAVRFSINPFLAESGEGANSYASRPCGEGLGFFLNLWVEVAGGIDPDTAFIVNVSEIDRLVRRFVVPVFGEYIRKMFGRGEHVCLLKIYEILRHAQSVLGDKFGSAKLAGLRLELNPFRTLAIESGDMEMFYFSEKFEFAAMHTLWNENFSEEENYGMFGKCANPTGHGHNYVVEITVQRPGGDDGFGIADFEKIVDAEFMSLVDHKNLNADVAEFAEKNPTVENIAAFAWERLAGKFSGSRLSKITVWENDRTYCVYQE